MTRDEVKQLMRGVPTDPTSRSTIELTNLITGKSDTFEVPSSSVYNKLQQFYGWSEKKLENLSVKVW